MCVFVYCIWVSDALLTHTSYTAEKLDSHVWFSLWWISFYKRLTNEYLMTSFAGRKDAVKHCCYILLGISSVPRQVAICGVAGWARGARGQFRSRCKRGVRNFGIVFFFSYFLKFWLSSSHNIASSRSSCPTFTESSFRKGVKNHALFA